MKRIAVITGASSGVGEEFAKQLKKYFTVDEIWLLARRTDRLENIAKQLETPVKVVSINLCSDESMTAFEKLLEEEKPSISVFINNAGLGYFCDFEKMDKSKMENCIDVNVKALTVMTRICLPYIADGGRILMTSSIASFVPNAYMSVYSSTKAYVSSFARALRFELKSRKIKVTLVCPGPMETEFLKVGEVTSKRFFRLPFCKIDKVVNGGLKACKKGKLYYTNRLVYKFYRLMAKMLPHAWLMKAASC